MESTLQLTHKSDSACMEKRWLLASDDEDVQQPSAAQQTPSTWTIEVEKNETCPLGMRTKKEDDHLLVVGLSEEGSAVAWNKQNPSLALRLGDKIISVNGDVDDPWGMIDLLWQGGKFRLQISRMETSDVHCAECLSHTPRCSYHPTKVECDTPGQNLQNVRAGDTNSTICAICFENYPDSETRLVQLPCKHAFHPCCVAMWFEKGKRRCPMCNLSVQANAVFGAA